MVRVRVLCAELARACAFPGGGRASPGNWYAFLVGLYRGERMMRAGDVVVIMGGNGSSLTRVEAEELIAFVERYGADRAAPL